jgi:hypothetical protein
MMSRTDVFTATKEGSHASRVAYRDWRASTFALLYPGKGSRIKPGPSLRDQLDRRVDQIVRDIWRSTQHYAERKMPSRKRSELKTLLRQFAMDAAYLDLDLKKHTAEMSFAYRKCRLRAPFDSDQMQEMIERKGRGSVRLIVAPPLYREVTYNKAVTTLKLILQAQVCSSILERLPRRGYKKAIISVYTTKADQTSAQLLRQQQSQVHSGHESHDRRSSRDLRRSSTG